MALINNITHTALINREKETHTHRHARHTRRVCTNTKTLTQTLTHRPDAGPANSALGHAELVH